MYGAPRVTGGPDYITLTPRYASEELEKAAGRDSRLAQKYKFLQQSGAVSDSPGVRGTANRPEPGFKKIVS